MARGNHRATEGDAALESIITAHSRQVVQAPVSKHQPALLEAGVDAAALTDPRIEQCSCVVTAVVKTSGAGALEDTTAPALTKQERRPPLLPMTVAAVAAGVEGAGVAGPSRTTAWSARFFLPVPAKQVERWYVEFYGYRSRLQLAVHCPATGIG